jgi:hypothetical protein
MATLHGKGGMAYLQGSGAAATKLGEAREWTIDIDRELADDSAMGDTWRTQLVGIHNWSGSIAGNLDTVETSPFDAAIAETAKAWYLYPSGASPTLYYYGKVWPNLSVSGGLGSIVSFSLSFEGDGQLAAK